MAASGREQPVGRGLRLEVRKVGWRQVAYQDFTVSIQQIVERSGHTLLSENAVYSVTQETSLCRHAFGKVAGAVDGRGIGREERVP